MLSALQALVSNSRQSPNGLHPLPLAGLVSDLHQVDKGRLPGYIEAEEVPGVAGG